MPTTSIYGLIDANGNGNTIAIPETATSYLYPDHAPLAWSKGQFFLKLDVPPVAIPGYGSGYESGYQSGTGSESIIFSVELSTDGTAWYPASIRNLSEIYDGATSNPMAAGNIQVQSMTVDADAQEIPIGVDWPAPYIRLVVTSSFVSDCALSGKFVTSG